MRCHASREGVARGRYRTARRIARRAPALRPPAAGRPADRPCARRLPVEREGLRIAWRMRLQVPPSPEPKWKRKEAGVKQATVAEWKPGAEPNRRAAKPQRKPEPQRARWRTSGWNDQTRVGNRWTGGE